MAELTKTTDEVVKGPAVKATGVEITRVTDTNIAKISGFNLDNFRKALEYNNSKSLALQDEDGEIVFKIEFTDKPSSLSHYGLLINKDTENVITVTCDPTNLAVLVKAKANIDIAVQNINKICAIYDKAAEQIKEV